MIKIGINGFGRIGRIIFRTCIQESNLEVANIFTIVSAINDPVVDKDYICYLINYDSTHGKFKGHVRSTENGIVANGKTVKIFHEKVPANIPWHLAQVHYVVEASGMFTNLEKAMGHLTSETVKRVIVTAPSVDIPMLILGVNEHNIHIDEKIISCASSTLYCLAPIAKILEKYYGVSEGFITSIHAMTPSLKPLDGLCLRGKHWRDHRSIHQNIIPAATGACKALNKIIPQLKDKLNGIAFRVPIVNVSVLDLTIRLNKNVAIDDIMKIIDLESQTNMKNIIKLCNEEAVSSDFMADEHSCIVDVKSSLQLTTNFFKIICWYENEHSYACRVVDAIKFSEKQLHESYISKFNSRQLMSRTLIHRHSAPYCKLNYNRSLDISFDKRTPYVQIDSFKSKAENERDSHKNGDYRTMQVPLLRDNKNLLFHSCVTFNQYAVDSLSYAKNQERLQKVKREVSKMIDMTEDLLKKTNLDTCEIDGKRNVPTKTNSDSGVELDSKYVIKTISKDQNILGNDDASSCEIDIEKGETIVKESTTTVDHELQVQNYKNVGTSVIRTDMSTICESRSNVSIESNVSVESVYNVNDRNTGNKIIQETNIEVESSRTEINIAKEKQELRKNILGRIIKKLSIEKMNSQASVANSNKQCRTNIYDKLESASETDSDNSFLIHERKSQVLDLTDLTSSAEDLARLDKICKIIEISDELSDKLFSSINTTQHFKGKKWSLKDLCERLQLDEFCNKVFGQNEQGKII